VRTLYRVTLTSQETHWLHLDVPVDTELSEEQIRALIMGSESLHPEWAGGFKNNHFASVEEEIRSTPWLDEDGEQESESEGSRNASQQTTQRNVTDVENETYYFDPATSERVTATYRVTLVVPTNFFGQIEIEAQSKEEAARLALDKAYEIDWEVPRLKLHGSEIEVLDIACDDPPEGALLSRPGSSEADISAHIEDAPEARLPGTGRFKKRLEGGGSCK
jgi:hypothetical protein